MNNRPDNKIQDCNGDAGKGKLMQDLGEMLPADHAQPVENSFEKDSNEGLAQINSEKLPIIIENLNRELHRHIKKTRKKKNQLPGFSFINITVITVLILIIIAWVVIRKMHS